MAITNYRVLYTFARMKDDPLIGFVCNVVTCLTGHAILNAPPVLPAALTTLCDTYRAAITAAINGGPVQRLERDAAREAVISALRQDASYVQMKAGTDLATLLSSGFSAMSTNRTQPDHLPQLTIKSVRNEFSELLIVNFDPVENARSYEVRYKIGNGAWVSAGVFGYSRNIVIPNLTRGEEYTVQGRAVGGRSGYGAWSDSVSRIIT